MGDATAALNPAMALGKLTLSPLLGGGGDAPKPPKLITKQEYDRIAAGLPGAGPGILGATREAVLAGYQVLPPPAPDLADETVQRARQAARRRLLMGGLTGPLDLTGGGAARLPGLTGT